MDNELQQRFMRFGKETELIVTTLQDYSVILTGNKQEAIICLERSCWTGSISVPLITYLCCLIMIYGK